MLFIIHYSGNQIKKNEMGRACGTCGGRKKCIRHVVGKAERRRPLGRPKRKWKDTIKMDLKGYERAWIGLICSNIGTSGGLLKTVTIFRIFWYMGRFLSGPQEGLCSMELV